MITLAGLTQQSFLTQDNSRFDEYQFVSWHIAGDECQTRKEQRSNHGQTGREKAIRKRDDALPRLRAWEGACIARGRGDVSLDARLLRWRECVATCFDFWNIAGQCAKENRFEGGDLQEFSVASGKGTQQPPFPFSGADEELDQLTSPAMAHLSHLAARR